MQVLLSADGGMEGEAKYWELEGGTMCMWLKGVKKGNIELSCY